jgi:hypothetical protein
MMVGTRNGHEPNEPTREQIESIDQVPYPTPPNAGERLTRASSGISEAVAISAKMGEDLKRVQRIMGPTLERLAAITKRWKP